MAAPQPRVQHTTAQIYAGESKWLRFRIPIVGTGAPKDLTGASGTWTLTLRHASSAALTKTVAGGGISLSSPETDGVALVRLEEEDTADLQGIYDDRLIIVDSDGETQVVSGGLIEVLA